MSLCFVFVVMTVVLSLKWRKLFILATFIPFARLVFIDKTNILWIKFLCVKMSKSFPSIAILNARFLTFYTIFFSNFLKFLKLIDLFSHFHNRNFTRCFVLLGFFVHCALNTCVEIRQASHLISSHWSYFLKDWLYCWVLQALEKRHCF